MSKADALTLAEKVDILRKHIVRDAGGHWYVVHPNDGSLHGKYPSKKAALEAYLDDPPRYGAAS